MSQTIYKLEKIRTQINARLKGMANRIQFEKYSVSYYRLMVSNIKPLLTEFTNIQVEIDYLSESDV